MVRARDTAADILKILWQTQVLAILLVLAALWMAYDARSGTEDLQRTQLNERVGNLKKLCLDDKWGNIVAKRQVQDDPTPPLLKRSIYPIIDALSPARPDCGQYALDRTRESRKKAGE